MNWNKNEIHHTLRKYDLLEDHIFDKFMYWWEEQNGPLLPKTPEWTEFWKGMKTLNTNSFFRFDWKTKEWVITKGEDEYRFPQNWACDDLENEPDLEMVWHSNYYNGPLSGMALFNGKYVWFDCFSDDYDEPYYGMRVYRLYQLSDEELKEEFYWHSEFQKHVGFHADYGTAYAPFNGKGKNLDKFYKPHGKRTKRNYKDNPVLGEFTEVQFRRERPLPFAENEGKITNE